jgi:hypothetical protein
MRAALEEELGPLGPAKSSSKSAGLKAAPNAGTGNSKKPIGFQPSAAGADPDADFDDAE